MRKGTRPVPEGVVWMVEMYCQRVRLRGMTSLWRVSRCVGGWC